MEDMLLDQATILDDMARERMNDARRARGEAQQLTAMAMELRAVADVMSGGPGLSQTFHPEPVNLNDMALTGVPAIAEIPRHDETVYLSTRINQSELILQAAIRCARHNRRILFQYPDGTSLLMTPDNMTDIHIPHALTE
jgi:hypothetical protein